MITCPATESARDEFLKHVIELATMRPGASPFVATKLKEGLKQRLVLGNRISRWEGPIPHCFVRCSKEFEV